MDRIPPVRIGRPIAEMRWPVVRAWVELTNTPVLVKAWGLGSTAHVEWDELRRTVQAHVQDGQP